MKQLTLSNLQDEFLSTKAKLDVVQQSDTSSLGAHHRQEKREREALLIAEMQVYATILVKQRWDS